MTILPRDISDGELIAFVDSWATLMEAENYEAAYNHTGHIPQMHWTPQLICEVVKSYGDAKTSQKVTLTGEPTDITQRKNVLRWEQNASGMIGQVWYDLNIDGFVSDLTATFSLQAAPQGIIVMLNDIHVM
jgi:hypothetical protein